MCKADSGKAQRSRNRRRRSAVAEEEDEVADGVAVRSGSRGSSERKRASRRSRWTSSGGVGRLVATRASSGRRWPRRPWRGGRERARERGGKYLAESRGVGVAVLSIPGGCSDAGASGRGWDGVRVRLAPWPLPLARGRGKAGGGGPGRTVATESPVHQGCYICCPLLIPGELLLPRPPPGEKLDGLILMVQATRFTCGGFAVGISFSHAVFDGQGAAQFSTAAGELARGLQAPSVTPVWDRHAIPDPPSPPPPQLTEFRLVTQVADISAESIARMKDEFKQAAATSTGEVCSTFDAVTAVVFKCRALALASALPDDAAVPSLRIAFAAGTRHLLCGVLPAVDGYYGNCVYLACVTRAGKAVREASLAEVVGTVREAKEAVPAWFAGWMRGVDHYDVPLDYSTVTVSDWSRVGFDEVDYGFGAPGYVFPLNDHVNFVASLNYVRPPAPRRGGIWVVLRCVEEPHAAAFAVELAKFA